MWKKYPVPLRYDIEGGCQDISEGHCVFLSQRGRFAPVSFKTLFPKSPRQRAILRVGTDPASNILDSSHTSETTEQQKQQEENTMQYKVERYNGRKVGNGGHMYRMGVQIVATDDNGKRRAIFKTARGKSPCYKLWEGVAHYISGLNKADSERYREAVEEANYLARKWNDAGQPGAEYTS